MRAATGRKRLKVMIVGAGTGGLCLAQGLKADGIAVEVFERERSPTDRLQGYRLSINATGRRALKECLQDSLFDKLVASCANPSRAVTFLDHRLKQLLAIDLGPEEQSDLPIAACCCAGSCSKGSIRSYPSARSSSLSKRPPRAPSRRVSRTDRALKEMFWWAPTGPLHVCVGNSCRTPSA